MDTSRRQEDAASLEPVAGITGADRRSIVSYGQAAQTKSKQGHKKVQKTL